MIKKTTLSFWAIALLSGCKDSFKDNLITRIVSTCGNRPDCTIDIRAITKFKWDRMYIFQDWTTSDSIAKAIGHRYDRDDVPDDYSRILFTDGLKVVYEEDIKSLPYYASTIEFRDLTDSTGKSFMCTFTPLNAIFFAQKEKIKGGCDNCYLYSLIHKRNW